MEFEWGRREERRREEGGGFRFMGSVEKLLLVLLHFSLQKIN